MKKSILFSLIVLVSFLSACSKKGDDGVTPDPSPSSSKLGFNCKIDGKTFAPDFAYATSILSGTYGIYGLNSATDEVMYLLVPANLGKGTHKIDDTTIKAFITLGKTTDLEYSTIHGGTGTLTIAAKDDKGLSGTFSYTVLNSKGVQRSITSGQFNVLFR